MWFSLLERFNARQGAGLLGQFPVGGEFALMELPPLLDQPGCGPRQFASDHDAVVDPDQRFNSA